MSKSRSCGEQIIGFLKEQQLACQDQNGPSYQRGQSAGNVTMSTALVNAVLREFYDSLNREEAALSADIAADRLGLLMRVAINELDVDFDGPFRKSDPGDDDHERAYFMRMGVLRIVKLAPQAHAQFDIPTVTTRRD